MTPKPVKTEPVKLKPVRAKAAQPERRSLQDLMAPLSLGQPSPLLSFAAPPAKAVAMVRSNGGGVSTGRRPLDPDAVDWQRVYDLRAQVADRLAGQLADRDMAGDDDRRQMGRHLIAQIVEETAARAIRESIRSEQIPPESRGDYVRAVDSAMFGYGRWQHLMDDPDVENIEILGPDHVMMAYNDRIEQVAPVASSAQELLEQVRFIATYSPTPKPFSPAHPEMTLNLEDRFRMHVFGFDVAAPQPCIVIRQHRFTSADLAQMTAWDMLPAHLASFLAFAVQAGASIVIGGDQGTGKTTFLRALAMAMDPMESVAVIETDAELFLHKLPGRPRVRSFTARAASGEGVAADGSQLGEISMQYLLTGSWRQNLGRLILGEVRSDEAAAMFQAMQSVRGSLSTIHAKHADAVLERLVTAAALGGVMRQEDAYRQIAVNIDLVIHLDSLDERARGGRLHRYVNQVMAIDGFAEGVNGPSHLPATNVLYRRDDPAAALIPPPRLAATMRAAGWQG